MLLAQLFSAEAFAAMLIFARIGSAVMVLPGFGEGYVMPRIRLGIALALTVVLYGIVRDKLPPQPATPMGLFTLVTGEILIGLFIGGIARLIMSSLHVAGMVISFLSGLSYAQTVDPTQGTQGALLSSLLSLAGITVVFVSGLHLALIGALGDSYQLFPAGSPPPFDDFAQFAGEVVAGAFLLGVQIAAPFIVVGLVFYISLGVLQRLIPQVQLFFIAIPVQIVFAFFLLATVFGATMMVFLDHFATVTNRLLNAG
jgi:flagellar biosynthetic protein FliR